MLLWLCGVWDLYCKSILGRKFCLLRSKWFDREARMLTQHSRSGPAIGPVIGGFLGAAEGWRWIFWLLAIVAGVLLILGLLILQETYAPVLYARRIKALIRETGDESLNSLLPHHDPLSNIFAQATARPLTMLFTSPIVLLLSIYVSVLFGDLYLFITTFPSVFQEQYHFSTRISGLAYLGLGVGSFLGLVIIGKTSDAAYKKLTGKNNGVAAPEYRLPPLMFTSPLVAIAFFAYGWSVDTKTHWIVPIISTSLFSMGMMPAFVSFSCRGQYLTINFLATDFNEYVSRRRIWEILGLSYSGKQGAPVSFWSFPPPCWTTAL